MLNTLAPYLLFAIYRLLYWTWRIRIVECNEVKRRLASGEGFVLAHWHGDELGVLHLLKRYHVATIISSSKDGDIMNKACQLLGAETARGSSTRGGTSALKGLLRLVKEGRRPSLAVDGPKGPIHKVKPGVLQVSRLSGLPIFPISFYSSSSFIFKKSWNQAQLPLPFSRLTVYVGEGMEPVNKSDDGHSEELCRELENRLNKTRNKAKQIAQGDKIE
ncbi:MAG: lysophospholipid acyltransferase family protein [Bdellovibrionales bacterium]|nr:lysophospholipid acyltransferase family protein [Bdellovibrionales bacterium]